MRRWSEFQEGTEEGILPLEKVMRILSTPRHTARLSGSYVTSVAGYGPAFLEHLKAVTGGAPFWTPAG